jgi:hypothetical protein
MIRQAHTYLVGALSGVVVIGIAIAAFIVLVSAQVFHDLPIPALSSSDQRAAGLSQGKALTGSPDHGVANTGGVATGAQPSQALANATPAPAPAGQTGANNSQPPARRQANNGTPTRDGTGPAAAVEFGPSTTTGTGDEGPSTSGGGDSGGSNNPQPSSTSKSPSSSNPGSVGGNNSNSSSGTSGGNGGSNGAPTGTSGSSGGAPSTGTSGGGSTTNVLPPTPVTTAKPSETVTEAVNGTVGTVDEALGGTLGESGVTKGTEEVVGGVAGPESVVGKTVDGVGEVVGGLVGGNGQ